MAEGALPRHINTALFTSSADNRLLTHRQLSRHLVTLWVTGNPIANSLLHRMLVSNHGYVVGIDQSEHSIHKHVLNTIHVHTCIQYKVVFVITHNNYEIKHYNNSNNILLIHVRYLPSYSQQYMYIIPIYMYLYYPIHVHYTHVSLLPYTCTLYPYISITLYMYIIPIYLYYPIHVHYTHISLLPYTCTLYPYIPLPYSHWVSYSIWNQTRRYQTKILTGCT